MKCEKLFDIFAYHLTNQIKPNTMNAITQDIINRAATNIINGMSEEDALMSAFGQQIDFISEMMQRKTSRSKKVFEHALNKTTNLNYATRPN